MGLAPSQGLFNKQHVCVLGSGFLCITYAPRGLVFLFATEEFGPFPWVPAVGVPPPQQRQSWHLSLPDTAKGVRWRLLVVCVQIWVEIPQWEQQRGQRDA